MSQQPHSSMFSISVTGDLTRISN